MPSLFQSLLNRDLGHLRIVAKFWGIELQAGERKVAHKELSERLLDHELVEEVLDALPEDAQRVLSALQQNQGKLPLAPFERQFGLVREVGPGKRDREAVHLNPISAAEMLFYRALLARAFFDSDSGAQEFAYIPNDLLKFIHHDTLAGTGEHKEHEEVQKTFGRFARPEERTHIILATDHLLDDLTTLLASLRTGQDPSPHPLSISSRFVRDLGLAARLISAEHAIQITTIKPHLEADRAESFAQLHEIWRKSETINELHQVPGIICEGEWINPVLKTREKLLSFVNALPKNKWWSLNAFITDIKEYAPDFQRTAGDYDAWFIRRAEDLTGFDENKAEKESLQSKPPSQEDLQEKPVRSNLRGFEHWDEVEGALIRYFVTGVLFWLGYVDLAAGEKDGEVKAFLVREKVESRNEKEGKIVVSSSGLMTVDRYAPRAVRYQLSRFGEWVASKNPNEFKYQVTTTSLERALTQGLKTSHLAALLAKFSETKIPPSLGKALRRWEVNGTEARVKQISVLRLSKPEDLEALRKSKAGRFLGMVLNPTTVEIREGASAKVMAALIEMGILMETPQEDASHQQEKIRSLNGIKSVDGH